MIVILKKELKSYVTSLSAYVYYGMFFLITGIFFAANCLTTYSTQFGYYVLAQSFYVLAAVIPLCTMRLLSQERRNKTDQLLFTAPVSTLSILTGKYLATLIYVLLPVLLSVTYPIVIAMHGEMSVRFVAAAYIGVVLMILVLLSIGMFISALTINAVLAAVLTYAVYVLILIGRIVESVIGNHDKLYNLFHEVSILNKYNDMISGIVRSGDVLYLLLLAVCFFILTLLVLESRRQSKRKIAGCMAATVAVTLALSAVCLLHTKVYDFTAERLLTLSDETKKAVAEIDQPTEIYYMGLRSRANATYHELLKAYQELNDNITVEYVDVGNDISFYHQYLSYVGAVKEGSLLVKCGEKSIYLNADDYIVTTQTSAYSYDRMLEIEEQLTRAIVYANNTEEAEELCVLTGHGEETLSSEFQNLLNLNNYEIEEVDLVSAVTSIETIIPDDCRAVLINAPQNDYTDHEINVLKDYLETGGNLFVTLDPLNEDLDKFYAFLKEYGLEVVSGVVVEQENGRYIENTPYYLMPKMEDTDYTKDAIKDKLTVLTMTSKGIKKNGKANGYVSADILTTSTQAFSKVSNFDSDQVTVKAEEDIAGPFSVASCAVNPKAGALFLLTSNIFFNEEADAESQGGNRRFFIEIMSKLTGANPGVWIAGKDVGNQVALYPNTTQGLIKILTIAVIPILILLLGILVLVLRKKGILLLALIFAGGVMCCKQPALADWVEQPSGRQYEKEDGEYAIGFTDIEGSRYYFDEDGMLVTGKFKVQEGDATSYYYADKNGVVQIGRIDTKKAVYMTDEEGRILTGFVEIDGVKYYYDEKAEPADGWFKSGDNWYYAGDKGMVMTGFLELDGYRYYLNPDGTRVSDTVLPIDGITYVFNSDGTIDENATLMYPVLEYINTLRAQEGNSPLEMNPKVQSCALLRAASLIEGYGESPQTMESLLATRGVQCSGGYEFSYGGLPDYGVDRLIQDMKKDSNMNRVLTESVSQVGLGVYEQDGINYYDIILIR